MKFTRLNKVVRTGDVAMGMAANGSMTMPISNVERYLGSCVRRLDMPNLDMNKLRVNLWITLPLIIAISFCTVTILAN